MKRINTVAIITIGILLTATPSRASLTPVQDIWGTKPSGGSPEWNLYNSGVGSAVGNGIMEYIYGIGNFARVDDTGDLNWGGLNGELAFKAVYAGASQALYTAGLAGTPISSAILTAAGSTGTTPSRSGSVTFFSPISQPFLFLDQANGNSAYSDPGSSSGGVDRMVTFLVTGYMSNPGGAGNVFTPFTDGPHYILGFEDGTDFDFNDLVVEVAGVRPVVPSEVTPVPEPTTVIAATFLLLPLGASAIRILRKNRAV